MSCIVYEIWQIISAIVALDSEVPSLFNAIVGGELLNLGSRNLARRNCRHSSIAGIGHREFPFENATSLPAKEKNSRKFPFSKILGK